MADFDAPSDACNPGAGLFAECLVHDWEHRIQAAVDFHELEQARVELLGKNGLLTLELKKLGNLSIDERRSVGARLNCIRESFEGLFQQKKQQLDELELNERLKQEALDVTLPTRPITTGKRHLLTRISDQLSSYFCSRGFLVTSGPEVDSEFNCFDGLNMPSHHPARQEQDTLYLKNHEQMLLRVHTSTMQIRTFSTKGIPVRGISTGAVFRNDAVDATHTPLFHQIEGFVAEPGITMAHMKYCLLDLLSFLFNVDLCAMAKRGDAIPVRFRPSFFPFTEPSSEVDCCCSRVNGELKLDMGGTWMEILGCGMIHPNVFKNCGAETFEDGTPAQGFAFGIGVERIAMLKYGVTDIRHFYDGDIRWLNHYG
ncbi:MAG: phenylalanine--tRNA ligase subunit alpha [Holosporales bacterium]|jgi:phenylalanyl-tRNA synthetase alpha chain|nr:phenylalanine--tRNA ligase subunit alpha [Holosporales bacterium]